MEQILNVLKTLRTLSGNAQLDYLRQHKSDLLKEILEYTYDPHKKFKIDEGKFNKINSCIHAIAELNISRWQEFKAKLDYLIRIKSATDEIVESMKTFILSTDNEDFLKMVLFKDLRLNMGIKKFQQVWPGFCEEPQVQLAQKWEGQMFQEGYYSRKLDGVRNYILDGKCYSRSNKIQNYEPIRHIEQQIASLQDFDNYVFDGELIYLNPDGTEDFQKAISLIRSEKRDSLCDNIYFIIFDIMKKNSFLNKDNLMLFKDEYTFIKDYLQVADEQRSWFKTKLPNILVIKQLKEHESDQLKSDCNRLGWEGLMYRDGNAPYEFKRTKSLLKIKAMQDIELKLVDMEEGTGKHKGRLGAFIVDFKGNKVNIGSGFSDNLREEYWNNKDKYIGQWVKTQYFEETTNSEGKPSLRFPVFLSFRDIATNEEFIIK